MGPGDEGTYTDLSAGTPHGLSEEVNEVGRAKLAQLDQLLRPSLNCFV